MTILRTFVGNANDIAGDDQNKQNLKSFLANLTEASDQAAKTLEQARDTIKQAYVAIDDYRDLAKTGSDAVDKVATSIVSATEELTKASSQINLMLTRINDGDGTIGKFITDGRLYEELLDTSAQMQVMVAEMKTLMQAINERGLGKVWKKGAQ